MGREQFSNTVKVEWVDDDPRNMRLLEDVAFTDSKGKVWIAEADRIIDGASIPRFFWRVIGSPFVGLYRRPSVLHDVHCETKEHESKDVHAMFLEAMIADGVPDEKAQIMYDAVRNWGPKWIVD